MKQLDAIFLNEWKDRIRVINKEFKEKWSIGEYLDQNLADRIRSGDIAALETSISVIYLNLNQDPEEFDHDWHGRVSGHRIFPINIPSVTDRNYNNKFWQHNIWNFKSYNWVGMLPHNY